MNCKNTLAYYIRELLVALKSFMKQGPRCVLATLYFLELTNGPNKLECSIIKGWKDPAGANTIAYWDHWVIDMKLSS
jgi:hypothetical protein